MSVKQDLESSLDVVASIGHLIKPHLGPSKSTKIINGEDGHRFIRYAALLLDNLDIEHPVGQYVLSVCRAFLKQYHTGEDAVLYFIYSWTRAASQLCHMGIPTPSVIHLLKIAVLECLDHAETLRLSVSDIVGESEIKGKHKHSFEKDKHEEHVSVRTQSRSEQLHQNKNDKIFLGSTTAQTVENQTTDAKLNSGTCSIMQSQLEVSNDDADHEFKTIELKSLSEHDHVAQASNLTGALVEDDRKVQSDTLKEERKENEVLSLNSKGKEVEHKMYSSKQKCIAENNDTDDPLTKEDGRNEEKIKSTCEDANDGVEVIYLEMKNITETYTDDDISWFFKNENPAVGVGETRFKEEKTIPYVQEVVENVSDRETDSQQAMQIKYGNSLTSNVTGVEKFESGYITEKTTDTEKYPNHDEQNETSGTDLKQRRYDLPFDRNFGLKSDYLNKDADGDLNVLDSDNDLLQDMEQLKAAIEVDLDSLKQNKVKKLQEIKEKQKSVLNMSDDFVDSEFDACFEMSASRKPDDETHGNLGLEHETEVFDNDDEFEQVQLSFTSQPKAEFQNTLPCERTSMELGKQRGNIHNDNTGRTVNSQTVTKMNYSADEDDAQFEDCFEIRPSDCNRAIGIVSQSKIHEQLFNENITIKETMTSSEDSGLIDHSKKAEKQLPTLDKGNLSVETAKTVNQSMSKINVNDFKNCFDDVLETTHSKVESQTTKCNALTSQSFVENEFDHSLKDDLASENLPSARNGRNSCNEVNIKSIDLLLKQFGNLSQKPSHAAGLVMNNSRHFKTFRTESKEGNEFVGKPALPLTDIAQQESEAIKQTKVSLPGYIKQMQTDGNTGKKDAEMKDESCISTSLEIHKNVTDDNSTSKPYSIKPNVYDMSISGKEFQRKASAEFPSRTSQVLNTPHTTDVNKITPGDEDGAESRSCKKQGNGINEFLKNLKLSINPDGNRSDNNFSRTRSNIAFRSRHLNTDIDRDFSNKYSTQVLDTDDDSNDISQDRVKTEIISSNKETDTTDCMDINSDSNDINKEDVNSSKMEIDRTNCLKVTSKSVEENEPRLDLEDRPTDTYEDLNKIGCQEVDSKLSDLSSGVDQDVLEEGNKTERNTQNIQMSLHDTYTLPNLHTDHLERNLRQFLKDEQSKLCASGIGEDDRQYKKGEYCSGVNEKPEKSRHNSISKLVAGLNPGTSNEVVEVVSDLVMKHSLFGKLRLESTKVQCHSVVGVHRKPLTVDGIIVNTSPDNMAAIQRLKGKACRVMLVNADIRPSYRHKGYKPMKTTTVFTAETFSSHVTKHDQWLNDVQIVLRTLAVDIILARGLISEETHSLCASLNVVAIETVAYQRLLLLSEASQVDMVTYVTLATQDNVCADVFLAEWDASWCDKIDVSKTVKHEVVVTLATNNPQTVVLSELTPVLTDLKEQEFWDSVNRLTSVLQTGSLLPGYGQTELSCVQFCRDRSENLKKSIDSIANLEHQYLAIVFEVLESGFQEFVDTVRKGEHVTSDLENQPIDCVYDDYISKIEGWRTAMDTVCTIVNTDSYIVTGITDDHIRYKHVVTL